MVVILSIAVGLWAGVFIMAFAWGMYKTQLNEVIRYELSHLQIHHPGFFPDKDVADTISGYGKILQAVMNSPLTDKTVARSKTQGMILSPANSYGVVISGVDPSSENAVTRLSEMMLEGDFLNVEQNHKILLGARLAKKLQVGVKGKVIIMTQDVNGEIVSGAFRVAGIFRTKNTMFDEKNVYVIRQDLNQLLALNDQAHEIAVLLKRDDDTEAVQQALLKEYPELRIDSWRQLNPELDLVLESFNEYMIIFIGIILLALMFGIINTQLMAVLERQRELGMLMAIGMNKLRLFTMILLESVYLALIGGVLGIILSYFVISFLHTRGINLSMFSEGLSMYGFGTYVYPELDAHRYLIVFLMTIGVAVIAALYPAWRALRLNPSESIRKT